jgi:hypothetical protein
VSTKAIREALRNYERHVSAGSYGEALVGAAREEVEAIERAALFIATVDDVALSDYTLALAREAAAASDTMWRIARESAQ